MARTARITLGTYGWLEYDLLGDEVRVGDRVMPAELWATFPGDADQPRLRMRLAVVEGVPQCQELVLVAKDNARGVRTGDLRNIPLEDFIEHFFSLTATRIVEEHPDGSYTGELSWSDDRRRETAKVVQHARSASRRKLTDDFLAQVADVYRQHLDDRPVEAVRQTYGVKYRTAAMYVERARAAKHLPPTTAGKKRG